MVLKANRSEPYKLFTAAIRPAGIFGEGDVQLMKGALSVMQQGRTNVQVGDNSNIFDFTYAGNVAHAHLLAGHALLHTATMSTAPLDLEKVDGEAFFVTNGEPVYFWDFMRIIWRYGGSNLGTSHVWTLPVGLGYFLGFWSEVVCHILQKTPSFTRGRIVYSSMTRYYNIGKARRVLRYRPQVSLEEGVRRGVSWFQAQEREISAKQ